MKIKKLLCGLVVGCCSFVLGYGIVQNNKIETYKVNANIKTREFLPEYDYKWDVSEKITLDTVILGDRLRDYKPVLVYIYNGKEIKSCDEPSTALLIPSISCEFDGWYTDEQFTNKVTGTTVGDVVKDIEYELVGEYVTTFYYVTPVYAKCKEKITCTENTNNTYVIEYHMDDDTGSGYASESVTIGVNRKLMEPMRFGYKFLGWYTNKDLTQKFTGTTKDLNPKEKYDANNCVIGYENVALYAAWEKIVDSCPEDINKNYVIEYYTDNSSSTASASETAEVGEDRTIMSTTLKPGYEFLGWYRDAALTRKFTGTTKDLNPKEKYDANNCVIGYENVALYAAWKKEDVTCNPIDMKVTVSYETNGGNTIDKTTVTLGQETYNGLEIPIKENSTFEGWYYDEALTEKVVGNTFGDLKYTYNTNEDECITGYNNITLFAKWSKVATNPETGDNIVIYVIIGIILVASGVVVTKKLYKK